MLILRRRATGVALHDAAVQRSFAIGLIFTLLAAMSGCSRDADPVPSYSGPLYPGAGLSFAFDRDSDLGLAAPLGDIYTDKGRVWYNAPLEPATDTYSVTDTDSGKILASGEVTVSLLPLAELELTAPVGTDNVSGRYGDVVFSASGLEATRGTAEFRLPDAGASLAISIDGDEASLEWQGVHIDGYGELDDAESAALRSLSTSALARALTMVALDLGCREEGATLDDAAFAALLFPWQLILKYEVADRGRAIPHFLAASSCSFSGFREEGRDEALNVAVLWDEGHPIPTTLFLFPFDATGQREARP